MAPTATATRDPRLDRLAQGSRCPRCQARSDEACQTPRGKVTTPHAARVYRAVGQYLLPPQIHAGR